MINDASEARAAGGGLISLSGLHDDSHRFVLEEENILHTVHFTPFTSRVLGQHAFWSCGPVQSIRGQRSVTGTRFRHVLGPWSEMLATC